MSVYLLSMAIALVLVLPSGEVLALAFGLSGFELECFCSSYRAHGRAIEPQRSRVAGPCGSKESRL